MKNSYLTLKDRQAIQEGLEKGLSRTEIAKNIHKDISTVAKEIKNRKKLKPRNPLCRLDKYFYLAKQAQNDYTYTLKDSREGGNLNTKEMLEIVDIIKPLLKKVQSVYQILKKHPELNMCPKTLYMYIESGIFQDYGINNFSLRRQVSMRKRKKLKKRNVKTSYEAFEFLHGNEILKKLNIQKIEKDMVTLQPYLLNIK